MPGVTEQEIAQAKQMNLYQYMQLCEPDNFKPEGPGQFRHKGHSSLTFAEDGSWTYFKTKATGRTALNYLIAVEGVSFVEAVQEINRIQGGVRPSFQPVKTPPPPAEKKPAKEFRLPRPDKNNYAATAYLRKRCIHPNVLTVCKQKRILYQTSFKDHPNCVFVGRDGNGEPKGGSLRGCSKIQFRRDIPGSKKINAVSFYDYKKLRTVPYRTARQIRDISDRLCIEAHLSVIDDPQKIGQLYPENAGKKKSVSNRTEIRKRLNFCLERATGYSQFLSMAKELEITPTIRGKHMSYLLEGAGRSVRDNSLSDTDTFTYAGICARLSDNAQEQKYLRRTITGILSTATGMADFADKLKTAGIETKVKKATGQVLYRATVLDGAWVPEDALGSEFTSEGIEYALKNGEMQIAEDAEITLIDRYQELTIQYPEVCTAAVKLSSRQILSAGKNGLVLQVHDDNGNPAKLMVNKSEVTTSPDGEIIFNVGNDFSYDLVYEDGTHGTIRGAKLIQQIDEENNVLPLAVVLTEDQIKTMSLRGVTIALPSKGIERLFIPEKYVVCNAANGQCAVSLYPNHQYSYIPTSGENKRNSIQGDQLAAILGVAINPSTENTTLSRRIAAVERRMGIENAKNLGKVLLGMTSENMYTAADYDKAILSLGKKQIDLTNKISAMQEKRKEVAAVTKSLQICKTYKPVWMQYVELPMSQKSAFYSGHSTELQAYSSAAKNLEKEGIDQSVDLDKAIGFTEQLERKIEETKEQLRETNSEEKKAQQERKKVLDIQENHTIN